MTLIQKSKLRRGFAFVKRMSFAMLVCASTYKSPALFWFDAYSNKYWTTNSGFI